MATLLEQLADLRRQARSDIGQASSEADLEALRVRFLGKKGSLAGALRGMGQVPATERPAIGQAANEARDEVEQLLTEARERLATLRLQAELSAPPLDVTLPGRRGALGRRHPLSRTLEDMTAIFRRMGFSVATGPQIELDHYNFTALNFPPDHPARDMQDTFFVDSRTLGAVGPRPDVLLRTHTSPVQVRAMLSQKPPVRIIAPGAVYRCDSDPTHSPMFHQVEGLYVDENVSFADLKGTLDAFVKALFGPNRRTRFRPSFFPFVEPGAEVDVSWDSDEGDGEPTRWLEILGAGMVHPNVLAACGIDPERYSGFAFGLGVERVAMLRYGIPDLRLFFENDTRFLEQF